MLKPGSPNKIALLFSAVAVAAGLTAVFLTRDTGQAVKAPPAIVASDKQQAMARLMALPELEAWSAHLASSSNGMVRGALIEYDPSPKLVNGQRYWQFSFVENGSDAAHRWESFLVSENGQHILVEDFATDQALTLEQWRAQKQPMQRTGPDPLL